MAVRNAQRRAFTLVEILFSLALVSLLIGSVMWTLGYGGRSTQRLTAQASAQQASRKALARFLEELQEGMLVLSPQPGATLSYALVKDKAAIVRWYYQVERQTGTDKSYELWRYVNDPSLAAADRRTLILSDVQRLTFTSRTEGALQLNIALHSGEQQFALLTTVRMRNLASGEQLW